MEYGLRSFFLYFFHPYGCYSRFYGTIARSLEKMKNTESTRMPEVERWICMSLFKKLAKTSIRVGFDFLQKSNFFIILG